MPGLLHHSTPRCEFVYHWGPWAKQGNLLNLSGDALDNWAQYMELTELLQTVTALERIMMRKLLKWSHFENMVGVCADSWDAVTNWPSSVTASQKALLRYVFSTH